jgi:hypothetical protein
LLKLERYWRCCCTDDFEDSESVLLVQGRREYWMAKNDMIGLRLLQKNGVLQDDSFKTQEKADESSCSQAL